MGSCLNLRGTGFSDTALPDTAFPDTALPNTALLRTTLPLLPTPAPEGSPKSLSCLIHPQPPFG